MTPFSRRLSLASPAALCSRAAPWFGRYNTVQSLKAAAAAALAWAVTGWWLHAPMALMAPWAAVVLVQGTVYRSLRSGVQQLLMITIGTLVAAGAAIWTGNTMAAMVIALPVLVLIGNTGAFGEQGLYAPTTGLFVLAYGSYSVGDITHRLLESAIGAAIGIGVNALVLPPVHSLNVRELVRCLPGDCADLLRAMADEITEEYEQRDALSWYARADRVHSTLSELRTARRWAYESYRFNPGKRLRRSPLPPPPQWDYIWERVSDRLRGITLTLLEAAVDRGRLAPPPPAALRDAKAVLGAASEVCAAEQEILTEGTDGEREARRERELARAWEAHRCLKARLSDLDGEHTVSAGGLVAETQSLLHDLAPPSR